MCIEEYNEAETMQLFKEEYLEQGDTERVRKSITRMVKVKGFSYEEACDYLGVDPDDFRDLETV